MITSFFSASLLLSGLHGLVRLAGDPVPDPSEVKPGWIALVVVLSLCAATTLLWLSLRKHLGRIQVPREDDLEDQRSADTDPPRQP